MRRISNGRETLKKMFTILSHQGNAMNALRFHLTSFRMAMITPESTRWQGRGACVVLLATEVTAQRVAKELSQ